MTLRTPILHTATLLVIAGAVYLGFTDLSAGHPFIAVLDAGMAVAACAIFGRQG